MGRFVVVACKPKAGMDGFLEEIVARHYRILQAEGLVTDRAAYVMRSKDGTLVEVFEWRSAEAVQKAHANPAILGLWAEFGAACDYVPLASLAEAKEMFAEFDAVAVPGP